MLFLRLFSYRCVWYFHVNWKAKILYTNLVIGMFGVSMLIGRLWCCLSARGLHNELFSLDSFHNVAISKLVMTHLKVSFPGAVELLV